MRSLGLPFPLAHTEAVRTEAVRTAAERTGAERTAAERTAAERTAARIRMQIAMVADLMEPVVPMDYRPLRERAGSHSFGFRHPPNSQLGFQGALRFRLPLMRPPPHDLQHPVRLQQRVVLLTKFPSRFHTQKTPPKWDSDPRLSTLVL